MKDKKVMQELIRLFNPKIDWMGFIITPKNYISYHHIDEKRNGGKETVDNGAILSRTSHMLLHKIEHFNKDLYLKWQLLFIDINLTRKPLTEDTLQRICELTLETKDFFISINKLDRISDFNGEFSLKLKKEN